MLKYHGTSTLVTLILQAELFSSQRLHHEPALSSKLLHRSAKWLRSHSSPLGCRTPFRPTRKPKIRRQPTFRHLARTRKNLTAARSSVRLKTTYSVLYTLCVYSRVALIPRSRAGRSPPPYTTTAREYARTSSPSYLNRGKAYARSHDSACPTWITTRTSSRTRPGLKPGAESRNAQQPCASRWRKRVM
jgi:hypothetical protein